MHAVTVSAVIFSPVRGAFRHPPVRHVDAIKRAFLKSRHLFRRDFSLPSVFFAAHFFWAIKRMLDNADYGASLQRYACFVVLLLNNKIPIRSEEEMKYIRIRGQRCDGLMKADWEHLEAVFFTKDIALSEQTWHLNAARS